MGPIIKLGSKSAKNVAITTVSLLALCVSAQMAQAQETPQTDVVDEAPATTGEITITGSRIVRDGYSAPTPVNVLSAADIQAQAPANLADFVNQLPSIAGSTTPASSTGSLSGGSAGINAISLRGIGANRTLVLLDGQRSVASTATGLVDVNTFPQELVERVEVVTGGASAAYGSDAVGGVVNFILNKNFKGLKMTAETGITDYGDGEFYKLTGTAGLSFMDNRLKILAAVEYYNLPGIHYIDRAWNQQGYFHITNPAYTATNGQPERFVGYNIGPSNATPGGVITAGVLRGTTFGAIDPATGRATTGTLTFGQVNGPWMIGGDWQQTSANWVGVNSFQPGQERIGVFGRMSFEFAPNLEVFAQTSYNRDEGYSVYISSINAANLTIRRDNAFLPTSIRDRMVAAGLTTITVGTSNAGIPPGTATNIREVTRYALGAKGDFTLFGQSWNWDAYAQTGRSRLNENLINTWENTRIANATDSIFAPAGNLEGVATGTITCRINADNNINNNDAACVPLNRIGIGGVTQAALDYVLGTPYRIQTITENVTAVTLSGGVVDLPAGPLAVALGAEYREEKVSGFVEERYKTNWQYGNYLPNVGGYNVKEAFLELAIPVFTGFDVSAAGRYTSYSTSGDVQTWKLGATFEPIRDIKLRGTVSHDIRAPNLDELFAAGTGRSNTVLIGGVSTAYQQFATGNPNLKPEVADSYSVGLVFTPSFLPGFAFSTDYYQVKITQAIGSIQPQTVADLCYLQNVAAQCANITTLPSGLLQIKLAPFNFSSQLSRGIDFETSYRMPVGAGDLILRGMATHYIKNLVDNGIETAVDTAGTNDAVNGGGPPSWIYRLSATYDMKPLKFNLVGRGVSAGVINKSYIECTTACPASTVDHRTINNNHIDGEFWLDGSVSYELDTFGAKSELQFSVSNIFNRDPVLVARGPTGNSAPSFPATNQTLYDMYGRTYRLSLRVKL